MLIWFLLTLLVTMSLNMPLLYAFGVAGLVYLAGMGMPLISLVQKMATALDSYALIAIPLFILAGNLMNTGGITNRLFAFARNLVGHIPGGLGHVNVVASIIFSGMSGNAMADAAGLGTIEIAAMIEEGYDPEFSAAVTAASATIGPIIPPSIPMVIYAVLSGASIGRLFIAGFIPGLLMGLALMILVYIIAIKRNYPRSRFPSIGTIIAGFRQAFLPLLTPGIIIGGIMLGIFTPTEAATVACVYALVLGLGVYREITVRDLVPILINTIKDSMGAVVILATATVFSWVLILENVPLLVTSLVLRADMGQGLFLLMVLLLLLFLGCFMTFTPAAILVLPILVPLLNMMSIDLVHFGVVLVLAMMIGQLTPPVGVNLFVVSTIARVPYARTVKAAAPFIVPLLIVLFMVTYLPGLALWLPNAVFGAR